MVSKVVFLGVGNVALHVNNILSAGVTRYGTTRVTERAHQLRDLGIEPLIVGDQFPDESIVDGADILVSIPPDGKTDRIWAKACKRAKKIVYISSTGIYGETSGVITKFSPVDESEPTAKVRLQAEEIWRKAGAIVLRCPGLYGPKTGLHLRLRTGNFKIPGDGSNYVSRIHLDDLANMIVQSFAKAPAASTFLVGDLHPSTHLETTSWLCEQMHLPLPDFADMKDVSTILRGNRQVDGSELRDCLHYQLLYPSFKEGYTKILRSGF